MVSDLVDAESDSINIAGVQGVGGDATMDILSNSIFCTGNAGNILTLPTSYQRGQQSLERQERFYARFAMFGVTAALLLELVYGTSFVKLITAITDVQT
jgi:hypothetical protein